MRRLLPLLVLAALASCSHRDRANPFDPSNPDTHGGPSGLIALAGDGRVDLRWDPVAGTSLVGYRLYRRTAAETTFRVISALLPPATARYADVGLLNGLDHFYRLAFVFDPDGERGQAAEDTATPGPARPWVTDTDLGQIFRIAPDGRRIAFVKSGLSAPNAVAIDRSSGAVWVSDAFAGNVVVLNPWTGATVTIPGLVSPAALAVEPAGHSAWVCDERGGTVYQFDPAGSPVGNAIAPIDTPIGVALDPADRSAWIAERGAGRVRHYSESHVLLGSTTVNKPSRVAVDSLTRNPWVTSFESGQVFELDPSGNLVRTIPGLRGPIGVTVDARRGRIWVADALASQLVVLDRFGTVLFRVGGISEVRDVSVDPATGEAWAVATGTGEVVRVSLGGTVLRRLGGFRQPVGISVDPGTP